MSLLPSKNPMVNPIKLVTLFSTCFEFVSSGWESKVALFHFLPQETILTTFPFGWCSGWTTPSAQTPKAIKSLNAELWQLSSLFFQSLHLTLEWAFDLGRDYFSLEVFKKHDKYSVNRLGMFVESRRMKSSMYLSFHQTFREHLLCVCCVLCKYWWANTWRDKLPWGGEWSQRCEVSGWAIPQWGTQSSLTTRGWFERQPSARCDFTGPLIYITLSALPWCLLFNIRAFLWIEMEGLEKAFKNANLLSGQG